MAQILALQRKFFIEMEIRGRIVEMCIDFWQVRALI